MTTDTNALRALHRTATTMAPPEDRISARQAIVNALPALLAYVLELEAERDALRECVRAADGLRAECDQVPPMVQQRNVLHAYDAARAKVTLP